MSILPESLNFLCPHKSELIRIGNTGDGGYVIPINALDRVEYLVSIGISDDWTFEEEASRRSPAIRIDSYDRTSGSLVFIYYGIRELLLLLRVKKIKKVHFTNFEMAKTCIQIWNILAKKAFVLSSVGRVG